MHKLLYAFLLLATTSVAAKTMLTVSLFFEEQIADSARKIETDRSFDITEKNDVIFSQGPLTCSVKITNKDKEKIMVEASITEDKDGVVTEIAQPVLLLTENKKGHISLGEKNNTMQKTLKLSALITH